MPSPDEDLRILRACLDGSPESRDAFARHFAPLVAGAVRSATGRASEDLCQEAFLALFADDCRKLRRFDPAKGSASGWVSLLARQAALDRLRRGEPKAVPLDARPPAEAPASTFEDLEPLRAALRALPPDEALCLALLVEQDLPSREVARILGVGLRTVYDLRDRALGRLRGILNKSGN